VGNPGETAVCGNRISLTGGRKYPAEKVPQSAGSNKKLGLHQGELIFGDKNFTTRESGCWRREKEQSKSVIKKEKASGKRTILTRVNLGNSREKVLTTIGPYKHRIIGSCGRR